MDTTGLMHEPPQLSQIWMSYTELAIIQGNTSPTSFLFQVDNYTKSNFPLWFFFSVFSSVISTTEISSSHMCSLIFFHLINSYPVTSGKSSPQYHSSLHHKPQNSYVQVDKHKNSIQNTTKLRKRPALHFELFQAQGAHGVPPQMEIRYPSQHLLWQSTGLCIHINVPVVNRA